MATIVQVSLWCIYIDYMMFGIDEARLHPVTDHRTDFVVCAVPLLNTIIFLFLSKITIDALFHQDNHYWHLDVHIHSFWTTDLPFCETSYFPVLK